MILGRREIMQLHIVEMSTQKQASDWEYARTIALPFQLQLTSGESVECQEILRLLPGRRLVAVAEVAGKKVLLKLFMGNKQRSDATDDSNGVKALLKANITTPNLLQESQVVDKGYPALLLEYLPDTISYREAWQRASAMDQQKMLQALVTMVAQQHEHGLKQRDFHLRNFIVDQSGIVYAIDGGDYAISSRPISRHQALKNLGMLFGHLPADVLVTHRNLLQVYLDLRHWTGADEIYTVVLRNSKGFRRWRANAISSKAFRNCSEFQVRHLGRLRICQRRDFPADELDDWIATSKLDFVESDGCLLKPGNSQTVWKTRIANQDVVLKRYNLKNWHHALRRAVTRSRASRSWQNAIRLGAYHIATPEPLAMIEERWGPLHGRAWLITRVAEGKGADQYFKDLEENDLLTHDASRLASIIKDFSENGIVHGDMKATNFVMDERILQVIDLDSMSLPLVSWYREHAIGEDRQRFLENWSQPWLLKIFEDLLDERQ